MKSETRHLHYRNCRMHWKSFRRNWHKTVWNSLNPIWRAWSVQWRSWVWSSWSCRHDPLQVASERYLQVSSAFTSRRTRVLHHLAQWHCWNTQLESVVSMCWWISCEVQWSMDLKISRSTVVQLTIAFLCWCRLLHSWKMPLRLHSIQFWQQQHRHWRNLSTCFLRHSPMSECFLERWLARRPLRRRWLFSRIMQQALTRRRTVPRKRRKLWKGIWVRLMRSIIMMMAVTVPRQMEPAAVIQAWHRIRCLKRFRLRTPSGELPIKFGSL